MLEWIQRSACCILGLRSIVGRYTKGKGNERGATEGEGMEARAFDERRTTQVAAFFLKSAPGSTQDVIKLVKLVYIADREALLRLGHTLTKGAHYSLPRGPIVSEVLDLLKGKQVGPTENAYWSEHIARVHEHEATLVRDPGTGRLADSHISLLREIQEEYGRKDTWAVVEAAEALPEHRKPHGDTKRRDIEYTRILCQPESGYTSVQAVQVARENTSHDRLRDLIGRA